MISHHPTYRLAWIQEHALIAYFQAPLNFPYITRILQFKSTGLRIQSSRKQIVPAVSLGQRLFLRLRRRLRTLGSVPDTHAFLYQAWSTIFDLASESKRSYDAARTIRSGIVHDWQVYALFRLCKHLEEPQRSKVKHIITSALKFRNLTVPQVNKPFTTPFLAHDFFSFELQLWLRNYILTYKEFAIPLHLPPQTVRESSFPTLRSFLHNHRRVEKHWDVFNISSLPCCCSQLLRLQNPSSHKVRDDGHCCFSLDEMNLPQHLEHFRNCNMNSTFFIAWKPFWERCKTEFFKWCHRHGLPTFGIQEFESFVQKQWEYHKQEIHRQRRFTFHDLQNLKRWLPRDSVLHHGDHEQFKLTVFCPQLYFQGCLNTWNDESLFRLTTLQPSEAVEKIHKAFPPTLLSRYAWGFRKKATLPYGFIFLKRQKQWLKGRTLISYFQSFQGKLLKAVSKAIDSMLQQQWPQTAGQLSTPQIWQKLHTFLQATPAEITLGCINDDLVGFFNSVPQDRLLQAVSDVVQKWRLTHSGDAISVDIQQSGHVIATTFAGSYKKQATHVKTIRIDDIFPIVQKSLTTHYFLALNRVWHQIRGAGIGSQISPILSNLAVTMVEHSWQDTFSQLLNAPTFPHLIIRYVDNRFVLFDVSQVNNTALQLFSSLDFYGPPVELETVDDGHFLGFQADPANRTFEYITPPPQQIRDFSSAGSLRLRLSGLQSRSHLVAQYSYPKMLTEPALKRLIQVYMAKGFSRQDCMKFIRHSERWDLNFLFKKLCVSVCSPCFWLCVFVWFLLFFGLYIQMTKPEVQSRTFRNSVATTSLTFTALSRHDKKDGSFFGRMPSRVFNLGSRRFEELPCWFWIGRRQLFSLHTLCLVP